MKITVATQNAHKIIEIDGITKDFGIELESMAGAGLADLDIEETGTTFEENSFIKASEVMKRTGRPAIADDTGLCVDALDGAPGLYSARFAGEHGNDKDNRAKLLELMKDVPPEKRTARFITVITLLYPDGKQLVAKGVCPGFIATEERGERGFGYDSLFIPEGYETTFAEMPIEFKNSLSHRARALEKLKELLGE